MTPDMTWILTMMATILAGAGGVIAFLFRALIVSKDKIAADAMKKEEEAKKSYKQIAEEAVESARQTTNYYRQKEGLPPLSVAIPVVPESSSPPTPEQRETAHIATLRETITAIKRESGQAPRENEPTE